MERSPWRFSAALLSCLAAAAAPARASLAATFAAEARDLAPDLVALRRELHKTPERAFSEFATSAVVRRELDALGVRHETVALTGVVGVLGSGPRPRPSVVLRADMDGLPLEEAPALPNGNAKAAVSLRPGFAHACGHDAHTAALLGAARLLKRHEHELKGEVRLLFQPAEEHGAGGKRMVDEGALGDAGAAFGLHVTPGFAGAPLCSGEAAVAAGPVMAGTGDFAVVVTGKGGHAAMPQTARDPVVAAAAVVTALQTVVSRLADPTQPAVVTVAYVRAGAGATNIIPESAELGGTFRAFDLGQLENLQAAIERVTKDTARAHGCEASVTFQGHEEEYNDRGESFVNAVYPPVVNDVAAVQLAKEAAEGVGLIVRPQEPIMGAEDFAFVAQRVPSAFVFLGHFNETAGTTAPNHNPGFDVDEGVLPVGAALLATLAAEHLERASAHRPANAEL